MGVYFGHFSFYSEENVNPRTRKKNEEHLENYIFPSQTSPAVVFCDFFFFLLDLHFSSLSGEAESWEDGKGRLYLLLTKRRQRKSSPSVLAVQKVINIATGVTVCSSFCSLLADKIHFFQSQFTVMLLDQ